MRRTLVVIFAVTAAALAGLALVGAPDRARFVGEPHQKQVAFTIGGAAWTMQVPVKAVLEQPEPGKSVLVRDVTRSSRLERTLVLSAAAGPSTASCEHIASLSDGTSFEHCGPESSGGSKGGQTQELSGVLGKGGRYLNVSCRDTSEVGANARWCFPALGSLRMVR